MSFLTLYRDPIIASVTGASDWCIDDLIDAPHPISLYFVIPPSDISRTKPLIRLILNQILKRLTERLAGPGRRKLLLMLDEFPALGRFQFFEESLGYMAGFGIRAFLIAQSLNQIEKAYGPSNSILDNCHVRVAFATNDERTAKRVSEALGTKTELRSQKNYAGHRLAPWLSHMMVSRQETSRPLVTQGEVMQLAPDEEIVMVAGRPPIRAKKLRYFKDRNFVSRVLDPPKLVDGPRPNCVPNRSSLNPTSVSTSSGGQLEMELPERMESAEIERSSQPQPNVRGGEDANEPSTKRAKLAALDRSGDQDFFPMD